MTQNTFEKLPPQNREAEDAILGSLMIDPEMIFDVVDFLKPEMFYTTINRWIYQAMLAVHNKNNPVDVLTVSEILRRSDKLDQVGGEPYLAGLIGAVPNSINAVSYARIVEAASVRRKLLKSCGDIASMAYDEEMPLKDVMDQSGSSILGVLEDGQAKELSHVGTATHAYLTRKEELYSRDTDVVGIGTGLVDLDRLTGGLADSDLIILAARPGMGKSSLQNEFILDAAFEQNKNVAVFNLEMPEDQLIDRMISRMTGIDLDRLRRGRLEGGEWETFYKALARLDQSGIFIDCSESLSPMQIRARCRRLQREHGIDMVVIDYLQLMKSDRDYHGNKVLEVAEISRGLKVLAKELDVPVLAAAQLSRAVESRQDKRPMLSDLRDSGSLEQDADIVMFIYRDDYYNPDTSERPNIAEINVAKFRNGATGTIDTYWNSSTAQFSNLARKNVDLTTYGRYADRDKELAL